MLDRLLLPLSLLNLLLCFSMAGCTDARPLRIKKNSKLVGPWCGPNQRVKIGERVVGHVGIGENKWKNFLVDEAGKEHDPEKIAEQTWSYLERTGDAAKIQAAFIKDARQSTMTVVSINPVVVILETFQDAAWLKQDRSFADKRWNWLAHVCAIGEPHFRDRLQWFSPELKQGPIALTFSEDGVAEIPLANGKLRLIRDGDDCKTERE